MREGSVLSMCQGEEDELNVELVHAALQEFQQELRDAQRERVCLEDLMSKYWLKETLFKEFLKASAPKNVFFAFRMKPRLRLSV